MDAYIYQADLICEDCAVKVKQELIAQCRAPENPQDENSFDSDDFPKGPYADGGGEADYPAHCSMCQEFLENPLTTDGYNYVEDQIKEEIEKNPVLSQWFNFYDFRIRQ